MADSIRGDWIKITIMMIITIKLLISDSSCGSNQREHIPGVEASATLCEGAAADLHDAKCSQSSWENPTKCSGKS